MVTTPGPQPVNIEGAVDSPSFFDAVGGHPTFQRLVAAFYARVADDPVLRSIYPEDDLGPAAERLRMFLEQYWGGPHTYNEVRGHPRLRARHAEFRIDQAARDAWLAHMRAALDEVATGPRGGQGALGLPHRRGRHARQLRLGRTPTAPDPDREGAAEREDGAEALSGVRRAQPGGVLVEEG